MRRRAGHQIHDEVNVNNNVKHSFLPARRHILTAGAAVFLLTACGQESGAPPPQMTPQVTVQEMKSTSVTVMNELPGRTRAFRVAEVRPQVNGIVEKRLFTEGSEVEAGEQLYQIDDATYQAAHKKAVANLRTAELQAKRYAELSKVNAVSRQAHDDAQAAYLQAQAEVEITRINLDYTKVLSPISGRIGRSAVTEGALVINGQPNAMATVQQLDPIYVDVTQSSVEIMRLRKAMADGLVRQNAEGAARVKLHLEDGSIYQHEGTLQFSEVEVSEGTGSVTIRAQFPNPERDLLPGMFVHAQIDSGQVSGVYLLPNQALMLGNDMSTVYVVDAENRVEARQVRNVRMVNNQWVITEGLQNGDRVVVEGRQKVRPGGEVEVTVQETADSTETTSAPAQ
ncbi:MAG: efflux RND transporter periplasmic adaptor subunit [Alcaligenaceae bacterium]|nr:efflux RND transporter periplasmic adaptor subunit [Alcaligenaceae bacterium]